MPRHSICVCSVQAPFITGGAEMLVSELAEQITYFFCNFRHLFSPLELAAGLTGGYSIK